MIFAYLLLVFQLTYQRLLVGHLACHHVKEPIQRLRWKRKHLIMSYSPAPSDTDGAFDPLAKVSSLATLQFDFTSEASWHQ